LAIKNQYFGAVLELKKWHRIFACCIIAHVATKTMQSGAIYIHHSNNK